MHIDKLGDLVSAESCQDLLSVPSHLLLDASAYQELSGSNVNVCNTDVHHNLDDDKDQKRSGRNSSDEEAQLSDQLPNSNRSSRSRKNAVSGSHTTNGDLPSLSPKRGLHRAEFFIGEDSDVKDKRVSFSRKSTKKVKISNDVEDHSSANDKKKDIPPPEFIPPDGGYGWVIAFSACISNCLVIGIVRSFGVIYVPIVKKFPEASAYEASWLPVLLTTIGLLIAPITGILCRNYTSRNVTFVGGLLCFSGLFLGAFAQSMTQMILSFGLLVGIGSGLTTTPGVLITSLYFEKKRTIASAICVSGNALGGIIFPPLFEFLMKVYGFQGSMMLMGALQLNVCAVALLYRPIRVHALIMKSQLMKASLEETHDGCFQKLKNFHLTRKSKYYVPNLISSNGSIQNIRRRLASMSENEDERGLRRNVSFMRAASMVNSIPDLDHYAHSWSLHYNPQSGRRSSFKDHSKTSGVLGASMLSIATLVTEKLQTDLKKGSVTWVSSEGGSLNLKGVDSRPRISRSDPSTRRQSMRQSREAYNMSSLPETDGGSGHSSINYDISKIKEEDEENEEGEKSKGCTCCTAFYNFFDCALMKNPRFLLVNFAGFLFTAGTPHAGFFLPSYTTSLGIDITKIATLFSISSIVDLFGRLGIALIADLKIIHSKVIHAVSTMMGAIAILGIPFLDDYVPIGVLFALFSFSQGAWFVMVPTILAKNHGAQRLASSYGLARLFHGLMNFLSPQICGAIIDSTKSYKAVYCYMGITMLVGSLIAYVEPIWSSHEKRKNKDASVTESIDRY